MNLIVWSSKIERLRSALTPLFLAKFCKMIGVSNLNFRELFAGSITYSIVGKSQNNDR